MTIEEALRRGIEAHQAGEIQEADRFYTAILQSDPKHPDANHNLGLIAVSVNKVEEALPLFKAALEVNQTVEQFWLSYIDALTRAGQLVLAGEVLSDARGLGFSGGQFDALSQQLRSADAGGLPDQLAVNRLVECYGSGRFDEAERLALSMTESFPGYQLGWKVLGAVYGQMGRHSAAEETYRQAVALVPRDAEGHNNLGVTLYELDRLEEAEASYRRAVTLKPDYAEAYNNLGNALKVT